MVEITRRRALGALGGGAALLGAAVLLTTAPPRVVSVDSEFRAVRTETADVHTRVVVENPNGRATPGAHTLGYTVTLNDVQVVDGEQRGVRIGPGRTVVETTAAFDNTAVPEWWVSHLNAGERTTMRTRTGVGLGGLPLRIPLPTEESALTTALLDAMSDEEASRVTLGPRPLLEVREQRASWGEADAETSPVSFTTTMENVHERPVGIDGTDYEIRMNDVVVGSGGTDERVELAPGETATVPIEAAIDTPKMQGWWVSHLRNDESTTLHVEVFAVVEDGGTRRRLPLAMLDQRAAFETDLLGTGQATVEPLAAEPTAEFVEPSAEPTRSEWGAVGDDDAEIVTTVSVDNENDEEMSDLLALDVRQETSVAGVTVATGADRFETIPPGANDLALVATKPHDRVPEWWAAHLANGERSATVTTVDADADVAVTTFPVEIDDRESTVETALLDDLNDDTRQQVTGPSGRTLFDVHATRAEWVDPTPEAGPIRIDAELENRQPERLTIRDVHSRVDLADVTLTDERSDERHAFAPGERRTVTFGLTLDNARTAEWWPRHVRDGERSLLDRQVTATVESPTFEERTTLEFLSETVTVETDLLAEE